MNINTLEKLKELRRFAKSQLTESILPFWRNKMPDKEHGGFFGETSFSGTPLPEASKSLILNARILYFFSAMFSCTKNPVDLQLANRAFLYIGDHFFDHVHHGYFWSLDYRGNPDNTKKQVYALAFVIYGMSEYYLASNNEDALSKAIALFLLMEEKCADKVNNGYFEAFQDNWTELDDQRLSDKDMNERKTMNTHLHLLEAYTNLYRIWKEPFLYKKIENLINLFLYTFISYTDNHLHLFFDDTWKLKSSLISYGHDIEATWLLHEAALTLGNNHIIKRVEARITDMTIAGMEGIDQHGGLVHERDRIRSDVENHYEWWPQAEALTGFLNTYFTRGKKIYLNAAVRILSFIQDHFLDGEHGEWFFKIDNQLVPVNTTYKAGLWKGPYHNGRACLKIIQQTDKALRKIVTPAKG